MKHFVLLALLTPVLESKPGQFMVDKIVGREALVAVVDWRITG